MTYTTIIGLLTATDQIIKQAVERDINGVYPRELEKSKGKIFLYRSHNSGFSFEFLKEYPALIKAIPLAAISAFSGVLTFLSMRKGHHLHKTALSLLIAGGLSNFYDRVIRGYVIDYFSIQWKSLKKVVLNLGDVFIFAGAVLLTVAETFSYFQNSMDDKKKSLPKT